MKNLSKWLITGLLVITPAISACDNDGNDQVGRDKGVPNGMEDNYTGDADHNKTGQTEEAVKSKTREVTNDAKNKMQ